MLDKKVNGRSIAYWLLVIAMFGHTAAAESTLPDVTSGDALAPFAISATAVYPLPSEAIRQELAQQLLELAIANVHPRLNELWLELISSRDVTAQGRLFAESFMTLKRFRSQWHQLSWDARERINLRKFNLQPTQADNDEYLLLLQQGGLLPEVISLQPKASHYLAMRQRLSNLLDMARQEPWPQIPDVRLHPGDSSDAMLVIRQALSRWQQVTQTDNSLIYDDAAVESIKEFQRAHGLADDGVIGRKTVAWLAVPPGQKAIILARTLLRQDVGDQLDGGRYVLVNLPEYQLRVLEGEHQLLTSRVIVGQLKRQTPILSSQIASVVLNPAWHVPTTILQKDIVPKLTHDPNYLVKERFDIYDYDGVKVDPASITLNDAISSGFPYRLRQQPGNQNALGLYKFYLPNDESIYLHSTSKPRLFNNDLRAISSGCVRVEQSADLAELLLKDSKWSKAKLDSVLQSKETKWVPLRTPVPVYTVYWRSWVDAKGMLQFRDDIYGFDSGKVLVNSSVMQSLLPHQKA
jgi:L,D-transpeptidase YcbB